MTMERRREFNKPLYMCFVDISKAYDSVNRELLWKVCRGHGISEKLVNLLKMLYKDSIATVRINGELSNSIEIRLEVLQGAFLRQFYSTFYSTSLLEKALTMLL